MARLFVICARDEPVAAILRRGPSQWYHIVQWNTARDDFVHGAWIKGRIYEEKCDVSPDGKLFVYFVHQGSRGGTAFSHAWTAVSRLPWLHALVLWPQETTYGGGGRFLGHRRLALRPLWHEPTSSTHPDFPLHGLEIVEADAELHRSAGIVKGADWSGHDHDGAVIYTMGDQLYRRHFGRDKLIADFSSLSPAPEPAPKWATRPL